MRKILIDFLIKFWKDDRGIAPAIAAGLKFGLPFLGGLFGGGDDRKQETRTTEESEEEFRRQQSGSTQATFGQQGGQLIDPLIQSQLQQLQSPIEFDQEAIRNLGFRQSNAINNSFAGAGRNLNASLAARGLNFSPGVNAVSLANLQGSRAAAQGANQANIEQQLFNLPQLRQRMLEERFRGIQNTLGLTRGSEFTSSSFGNTNRSLDRTQTGTSGEQGGFRNAFGGLASALALNAGNGPEQFNLPSLQGGNPGNSPLDPSIQAPNFNRPLNLPNIDVFNQQNPLG